MTPEERKEYNRQYRIKNADKLKQKAKQKYQAKKEKIIEERKNKVQILERAKEFIEKRNKTHQKTNKINKPIEKVICDCGIVVNKNYLKQHLDKNTHKYLYATKEYYLTGEIICIPIDPKYPKAYYGF